MPEETEIETERLRESIREELEKEGGAFLKQVARTTAILPAFAAIASMRAGDTVSEALVLKTEATRLEGARDAESREADELLHAHRSLAQAVALFQVAIALGAVAALTRQRVAWFGSILLGAAGAALFVNGFLG